MGRADQRKQETGMGEAPVSVLHRLGLLTRTLCILLHPKVSTALVPGVREQITCGSVHPVVMAAELNAALHLVIPSAAEGPTVRLSPPATPPGSGLRNQRSPPLRHPACPSQPWSVPWERPTCLWQIEKEMTR